MHDTVKNPDGTFNIEGKFVTPIILDEIGEEFIYQIDKIEDLVKFVKFSESIIGVSNTRYVERYWRISYDDCKYSDWYELPLFQVNENDGFKAGIFPLYNVTEEDKSRIFDEFPDLSSAIDYQLEIKWIRSGSNPDGLISISGFSLDGVWDRNELSYPYANLTPDNARDPIYIKPADTFKVFRLDDVEVIVSGETPDRRVTIEYRISQDNWLSSTPWEELTKENISTAMNNHRLSPIRFFWIEYRVFRSGTDFTNTIKLHDINLIGDIQNVSEDYTKTNLMGLRECCKGGNSTNLAINEGSGIPGFVKPDSNTVVTNGSQNEDACLPPNLANPLGTQEVANLWQPYNLQKAVDLYGSLSNSTNEMFGWEVTYFLTDPDRRGTDHTFHEHQLKNVIDENSIKISVDNNQFPDNQITFNQFDLSLFESFEVHITKENFKRAFGVDQRPSKEDFLWFCDINKIYQVEHAQPFRDFMNASVFYKVILKKYNQKASVQPANQTIAARIDELTKNTKLDELFGLEIQNDKEEVANKDQYSTLSKDKTRYEFTAEVVKELIPNASIIINKYNYNLSNISPNDVAVRYSKVDSYVKKSDNRSYSAWFKIPEYVVNESYNFINNHDGSKGYKIDLMNGEFTITFNNDTYTMPVDIIDNVWYCFTVNINQRQRKIEQFLYKRNVDNENEASRLKTSILRLIKSTSTDFNIGEFEFDDNTHDIVINGSNMNLTNIRIYNDIVEESSHTKILNQNILRDSDYLILADNSNNKVVLDNYGYN